MANSKQTEIIYRIPDYDKRDINDKIILNLRDIGKSMLSLYEGKGSQKRVLIILKEVENITQRELTIRLGIQPGSVSELLTKLENSGKIIRTKSKADRRTMIINLTEEGKKIAIEATEQRIKRHEEMFSCLTNDEKKNLLALLEKINVDWDSKYRK